MTWPESIIDTPQGKRKAVLPLVVSASRATDIPAFHASWFMNRLREGYCLWKNPFNAAQRQWISFEACRVFVFWSKHPAPLLPHLSEIAAGGREFCFQYTLNDYEGFGLEPNLPPLEKRVETFRQLSELVGKKRVIWRFDPIILGGGLTVENTLARLRHLAEALSPFTEKLVFSFVDWYRKTARELGRLNPAFRPPTIAEMQALARGMADMNHALARPLRLATCAEPLDLRGLGIERNRCVDPELLYRLCPDCGTFARWCGKKSGPAQLSLFEPLPATRTCAGEALRESAEERAKNAEPAGPLHSAKTGTPPAVQDEAMPKTTQGARTGNIRRTPDEAARKVGAPGRRSACGCAPSKDIGGYDTCRHFCAYCYANRSEKAVLHRLSTLSEKDESL